MNYNYIYTYNTIKTIGRMISRVSDGSDVTPTISEEDLILYSLKIYSVNIIYENV